MTILEEYYNKFNEEKRLNSRHGQVEFLISMHYIHKYLKSGDRILDIGAGTGRYSIPLFEEGYDVTAIEAVQHNLGMLKQKNPNVNAYKGNALKLKRCPSDYYNVVLLFGPMYHLTSRADKIQALSEAKRVLKPEGVLLVAYTMNEFSILTYGFKEKHVMECLENGQFSPDFKVNAGENDLYDYVRIEDIDSYNAEVGLKRELILSPDGPANYMRPFLNQLSEEEFAHFVQYQMSVCERPDLIGAGAHTVDILRK